MIVCYAEGGGLGHLTRVAAYLATVYPGRPATVLSSSPHALDPRATGGHPVLTPPAGLPVRDLTGWLGATLAALHPSELVVDAFPRGLRGELTAAVAPRGTRVTHLARLLRWDAYRAATAAVGAAAERTAGDRGVAGVPLHFDRTWCLEPLHPEHRAWLAEVSEELSPLELVDPAPVRSPDPEGVATGAWLVVHGGPPVEVAELLRYARDTARLEGVRPRVVLVSGCAPEELPPELLTGVTLLTAHPAWPLFARAGRLVTAAGFNAVRQAAPWRERHRMLPFPRRFDDQFTRARDARRWTPAVRTGDGPPMCR